MPYIGRNHIAGDHTSNFKVLDDISSYTATFNGSSTNVVSTANETLRILEHRFIQGQRVTYTNGGGGNIGGLTTGTAYFVTFDTHNTIKLATSLSNANNNININLSSVGSGTAHTLNAAFDGTNTKFKLTHNSGDDAIINNATQLQVAINNVIQRPNQTALSFTEGFAIEDNHKIVFKTAPTSNDVFWGSIIANTIESFDSSDFKVDNFTGDGSTTTFTLSKDVPNVQSLMVTLDGVTQHASDNTTTRSYSLLSGNTVEFTAPPGVGIEIQVKHLGFAGAATGEVSGFYGRTGNVTLSANDHITTGDITARNFKATGITTFSGDGTFGTINATTGTFSGNVSIVGTLTYEDVTNIDSVGIITARSSIYVADSIIHQGDTDTKIDFATNDIRTTVANKLRIHHAANGLNYFNGNNISQATSTHTKLAGSDYVHRFRDEEGDDTLVQFFNTNVKNTVLEWNDYGSTTAAGNLIFKGIAGGSGLEHARFTGSGNFNLLRDLDVDGHTNLDNVSIAGFTTITQDLDVDGHTNLDNVSVAGITTISGVLHASNTPASIRVAQDIQHLSDTDTKISFPADDTISLDTGGTQGIRITSAQKLLVGDHTSSRSIGNSQHIIQTEGTSADENGISLYSLTNNQHAAHFSFGKSRNNSTVADNDFLGHIIWCAHDGTDVNSTAARITASIDGATGSNDTPGRLEFYTTSDGSHLPTERLRINSSGHVVPAADSSYDLGLTGTRFRNVYADTLYGDGSNLTGIAADKIFEGNTEVETVDTGSDGHIKFTTEGTERLRIKEDGKIEVPTTGKLSLGMNNPVAQFTAGTANGSRVIEIQGTDGVIRGYDRNSSSWAQIDFEASSYTFDCGGQEKLRIDSSGNLMIGSSSAEAKLDVTGGVSISSNGVTVSPSGYDLKIRSNTAKLGIHIDNASGTPILEFGIGGATGGRITTNTNAGPIIIAPNNVERLRIAADGQVLPGADDAQNLGSSTKRWKNIYAADMHFSNKGKTNDVDGTWGDWTLQEGEDSVFMINNRTGKKYAITMREVN